jgi:hypothetical protein
MMRYELEFVILQDQYLINNTSLETHEHDQLSVNPGVYSRIKNTLIKRLGLFQSRNDCCTPCC